MLREPSLYRHSGVDRSDEPIVTVSAGGDDELFLAYSGEIAAVVLREEEVISFSAALGKVVRSSAEIVDAGVVRSVIGCVGDEVRSFCHVKSF